MNDILEFLKGKKTYLIGAATVTLGVLQAFDVFVLPEWAWMTIAGLGLATLRAGVNKIAESIKPPE